MRRRGTGDYVNSGNYDWQFYPNIYRFIAQSKGPGGVTPDYASASSMGLTTRALGGLGCGSGCGCNKGVGQVDFSFLTNPVSVFGYSFPLWIGLAAGIGAIALMKGTHR